MRLPNRLMSYRSMRRKTGRHWHLFLWYHILGLHHQLCLRKIPQLARQPQWPHASPFKTYYVSLLPTRRWHPNWCSLARSCLSARRAWFEGTFSDHLWMIINHPTVTTVSLWISFVQKLLNMSLRVSSYSSAFKQQEILDQNTRHILARILLKKHISKQDIG